ncbi:DNA-processing protein DprA [Stygiobacter electus]|uniref:DNA-processing protein DprA n=1 Tax=Stygiobacter electus TaxID=3032292 RepID=A0AAE3P194_9BACT|nr:DNA-processing protein DprA [Stygiobacter electus]MDF1612524.1 DNA-processing protein DprA [Stygiobacter electus]
MNYLGNKEILNNYKVGFLCSRKVPANIILKTYDWAVEQRDKDVCIVSGFHSKIEKDVFDILIKGTQPIILVLARGMMKRFDKRLTELLYSGRLLIISPFDEKVKRPTTKTAQNRNELIAKLSDKIYIAHAEKNGSLEKIEIKYFEKVIKN